MKVRNVFRQHISQWGMLLLLLTQSVFFSPNVHAVQRPKVGLVLSGGGAKGVAHIGVLKVIEEAGIPVDYISGTSMGAIIGGLYSIGYSAQELDSMVRAQDWKNLLTDRIQRSYRSYQSREQHDKYLLSVSFSNPIEKKITLPAGVMKGQSILNKFSDLTVGYHQVSSFDSLPIPFSCVAGDLTEGKEVVIRKGSLPLAMRASMAIPSVFAPVYQDSMVLIDGGIFNNFPVDIAQQMGADIIIGVDLSTKGMEEPDYHSIMEIADRIAFLTGEEKKEENMKRVDIYLNPRLKGYTSADFNPTDIDSMIIKGERIARKNWNKLIKLKELLYGDTISVFPTKKPVYKTALNDSISIDEVTFLGLHSYNETWIKNLIGIHPPCLYTVSMVENDVKTLQGSGLFSEITYRITNEGTRKKLLFLVKERPQGSFHIGMHLDTEDIASILMHTQFKTKGKNGSTAFATARINQNPWLNVGYTMNTRRMKSLELSYRIGYNDFALYRQGEKKDDITFLYNSAAFSFKEYFTRKFTYRFGIQYEFFSNVSQLYTAAYQSYQGKSEGYASCFMKLGYDTFDNLHYPSKGTQCNLTGTLYGNHLADRDNRHAFAALEFNARFALPLSSQICLLPEITGRMLAGSYIPGFYQNYAGGEFTGRYLPLQQVFYGIQKPELFDHSLWIFRLACRYRITDKHYLSCIGNYAACGNKLYRTWQEKGIWGAALKYSYDSLIGPLSLIAFYSNQTNQAGFYANIGYYF